MPSLKDRKKSERKKVLLIGDSGAGKTSFLRTMPKPFVADFDNGLDTVAGLDVEYMEFFDEQEEITAWGRFKKLLKEWKKEPKPYESFMWDSISFGAEAALRFVLKKNGRLNLKIQIGDWGEAIKEVKDMLAQVTTLPNCHIVVTAHYMMLQDEHLGGYKYVPAVYGKDLPGKIPTYFNDVWRPFVTTQKGQDGARKPVYRLQVQPSDRYTTIKNSFGDPELENDVEPNFTKLLERYDG
jgi:hypothetical protein